MGDDGRTGRAISPCYGRAAAVARRWRQVYEVVVTDQVPIRAVTQVSFETKNFLTAELFAAPLSEDGGRVDTRLVSLAFWSNTGRTTA